MPKSRRAATLTLDEIVEESVGIVRTQGVSGLTMRSVAAGLGVTPMAIYYYVTDKDDLVRLVVGRVSDSFGLLQVDPDRPWQEVLREYMVNIWREFRRYPGLSSYFIDQPSLGVTPDRLEAGLAFFEAAGFAPAQAHLAWSFATTYIHGRISVDAHLGRGSDASHAGGLKAGDYVEFGVDAAVAGLASMLDAAAPPPPGARNARYDERGVREIDDMSLAGEKG
jgi:AcrR family transcriptional regulator